MRSPHPFTSGELMLHHRAGGASSPITCGVKHGCITAVVEDVACPKCLEVLAAGATADFIQEQAKVLADASRNLDTALFAACPGPHVYRQHRDGKPSWCKACGYTSAGRLVKDPAEQVTTDPRPKLEQGGDPR